MIKTLSPIKTDSRVKLFLLFTLILVLLSSFLLLYLNSTFLVTAIIDGDTLRLDDGRRIRLLSVDAPDESLCMGNKAKEMLENLTLNKRISLKSALIDDYGRTVANIYVFRKLISLELVEKGFARFTSGKNPEFDKLKKAHEYAKTHQVGIYSPLCRQKKAIDDCDIKGNIRKGVKTYYTQNCRTYSQVIIDKSYGDLWFCTEREAQDLGFQKAANC